MEHSFFRNTAISSKKSRTNSCSHFVTPLCKWRPTGRKKKNALQHFQMISMSQRKLQSNFLEFLAWMVFKRNRSVWTWMRFRNSHVLLHVRVQGDYPIVLGDDTHSTVEQGLRTKYGPLRRWVESSDHGWKLDSHTRARMNVRPLTQRTQLLGISFP